MIVTPNPERRQKLINNAREVSGVNEERTGTHLSDLTVCITKTFWKKFNKGRTINFTDQTVLFFLIGLGLEKMLRGGEPAPATKIKDGVEYTPDHYDPEFEMFDEMKSTRMGWKKDGDEPTKGWPAEWIRRMKGYCYAEGVEKWGMDVFLVIPAQLHAVDFTFDPVELQEFWHDYVLPRKAILEEALETGVPPKAFEYNDDWECEKCEALLLCENSRTLELLLQEQKVSNEG